MKEQVEGAGCAYQCHIMFEEHVTYESEAYRQLSRLGPTVSVADQKVHNQSHHLWLRWNSIDFAFSESWSPNGGRPIYKFLLAKTSESNFRQARLGELVDLLFERGVLQYGELEL